MVPRAAISESGDHADEDIKRLDQLRDACRQSWWKESEDDLVLFGFAMGWVTATVLAIAEFAKLLGGLSFLAVVSAVLAVVVIGRHVQLRIRYRSGSVDEARPHPLLRARVALR